MTVPHLVRPSEEYKKSYIEAYREFHAEGRWLNKSIRDLQADFGGYVRSMLARADRATQEPNLVPETFYWLVEGDEWIGVTSIRHELTEHLRRIGGHIGYAIRPTRRREGHGKLILKLVLEKAGEFGLTRALLTCDSDNIGSKKIIEVNGGVLEDEVEAEPVSKLRYWIDL
jgi:predicted acetyltransferase